MIFIRLNCAANSSVSIRDAPSREGKPVRSVRNGDELEVCSQKIASYYKLSDGSGFINSSLKGATLTIITGQCGSNISAPVVSLNHHSAPATKNLPSLTSTSNTNFNESTTSPRSSSDVPSPRNPESSSFVTLRVSCSPRIVVPVKNKPVTDSETIKNVRNGEEIEVYSQKVSYFFQLSDCSGFVSSRLRGVELIKQNAMTITELSSSPITPQKLSADSDGKIVIRVNCAANASVPIRHTPTREGKHIKFVRNGDELEVYSKKVSSFYKLGDGSGFINSSLQGATLIVVEQSGSKFSAPVVSSSNHSIHPTKNLSSPTSTSTTKSSESTNFPNRLSDQISEASLNIIRAEADSSINERDREFAWENLQINFDDPKNIVIGRGSFGVVVRATLLNFRNRSHKVALKVICPSFSNTQRSYDIISRQAKVEADIIIRANYLLGTGEENITRCFGVVEGELPKKVANLFNIPVDEMGFGIIMRYEEGGSLENLLFPSTGVPKLITLTDKVRLALGIIRGISDLHSISTIHGDIKPANILLSKADPQSADVRLADFGTARLRDENKINVDKNAAMSTMSMTNVTTGTPYYCAPEMLEDPNEDWDDENGPGTQVARSCSKTDIYAFAILTWQIFSGKKPYDNKLSMVALCGRVRGKNARPDLNVIPKDTPQNVIEMIKACWDKDRSKRLSAVRACAILERVYLTLLECHYNIFLSHRWENSQPLPFVSYIFRLLSKYGFRVWFDIVDMGYDITDSMTQGISNSDVFLCCINRGYQESKNCLYEIREANRLTKPIVSLVLDENPFSWATEELKGLCNFSKHMFIDLSESSAEDWSSMADSEEPTIEVLKRVKEPLQMLLKILQSLNCNPAFDLSGCCKDGEPTNDESGIVTLQPPSKSPETTRYADGSRIEALKTPTERKLPFVLNNATEMPHPPQFEVSPRDPVALPESNLRLRDVSSSSILQPQQNKLKNASPGSKIETRTISNSNLSQGILFRSSSRRKSRPARTNDSHSQINQLVFCPDKSFAWLIGKQLSTPDSAGNVTVQIVDEEAGDLKDTKLSFNLIKLDLHALPTYNPGEILESGVDNMSTLSNLTEPLILENLRRRFKSSLPYTYSGETCIAINPYKTLPIYTDDLKQAYLNADRHDLEAHVFAMSSRAYHSIVELKKPQCILMTGDSGAGKTETCKILMSHIAQIAGTRDNPVIELILRFNSLLENFGNAKTMRNDNSSRFGRITSLVFDDRFNLHGATTTTFLLERQRIVRQCNKYDTNFHIFYDLLSAPEEIKNRLNFINKLPETFKYLCGGDITFDNKKGGRSYGDTRKALESLRVDKYHLDQIEDILAAILHLGQLEFFNDKQFQDGAKINQVTENDKQSLKSVCDLLGIPADKFSEKLVSVQRVVGNEQITSYLNVKQAAVSRNSLAKEIYSRLFDHIVSLINDVTNPFSNDEPSIHSENLQMTFLDIFGFETFQINGFEQFAINYANEILQQRFIQDVFLKRTQDLHLETAKMTASISTIESVDYIINSMTEICNSPTQSDSRLFNMVRDKSTRSVSISVDPWSRNTFSIKHYSGIVSYCVDGFLDSNRENIQETLVQFLGTSSSVVMKILFGGPFNNYQSDNGRGDERRSRAHTLNNASRSPSVPFNRGETLNRNNFRLVKFRNELQTFMTSLKEVNCHYIRCIKPNMSKSHIEFDKLCVVQQLRSGGVVETIRFSRSSFPNQLTYREFMMEYSYLFHFFANYRRDTAEFEFVKLFESLYIISADQRYFDGLPTGQNRTQHYLDRLVESSMIDNGFKKTRQEVSTESRQEREWKESIISRIRSLGDGGNYLLNSFNLGLRECFEDTDLILQLNDTCEIHHKSSNEIKELCNCSRGMNSQNQFCLYINQSCKSHGYQDQTDKTLKETIENQQNSDKILQKDSIFCTCLRILVDPVAQAEQKEAILKELVIVNNLHTFSSFERAYNLSNLKDNLTIRLFSESLSKMISRQIQYSTTTFLEWFDSECEITDKTSVKREYSCDSGTVQFSALFKTFLDEENQVLAASNGDKNPWFHKLLSESLNRDAKLVTYTKQLAHYALIESCASLFHDLFRKFDIAEFRSKIPVDDFTRKFNYLGKQTLQQLLDESAKHFDELVKCKDLLPLLDSGKQQLYKSTESNEEVNKGSLDKKTVVVKQFDEVVADLKKLTDIFLVSFDMSSDGKGYSNGGKFSRQTQLSEEFFGKLQEAEKTVANYDRLRLVPQISKILTDIPDEIKTKLRRMR